MAFQYLAQEDRTKNSCLPTTVRITLERHMKKNMIFPFMNLMYLILLSSRFWARLNWPSTWIKLHFYPWYLSMTKNVKKAKFSRIWVDLIDNKEIQVARAHHFSSFQVTGNKNICCPCAIMICLIKRNFVGRNFHRAKL